MNGVGALKDYSGRGKNSTGRLLYAAYARNQGKALNAIFQSIENAKRNFILEVEKSNKKVA
jgi:alpha-D-ribose 1-methylphosphonate 5-triphosphate synthase subunit PhnL